MTSFTSCSFSPAAGVVVPRFGVGLCGWSTRAGIRPPAQTRGPLMFGQNNRRTGARSSKRSAIQRPSFTKLLQSSLLADDLTILCSGRSSTPPQTAPPVMSTRCPSLLSGSSRHLIAAQAATSRERCQLQCQEPPCGTLRPLRERERCLKGPYDHRSAMRLPSQGHHHAARVPAKL